MSDETETEMHSREEMIARMPSDQRFTWELTPLPGRLLFAETIGASLVSLKDIFTSLNPGGSVVTILNCGFRKSGAFFADMAVLPLEKETTKTDETPAKSATSTSIQAETEK